MIATSPAPEVMVMAGVQGDGAESSSSHQGDTIFGEDCSMARMTRTRRIVITTAILVAASAMFAVIMLASRPMSPTMAGMDMSGASPAPTPADHGGMAGMEMSGSDPTPTQTPAMDPGMAGMDMSGSTPPTPAPTPTMDPDMPGMSPDEHGDTAEAPVHRPLAPVLGTFGGGTAAVLITAGMLRRKDRAANLARKAARAAGRARK